MLASVRCGRSPRPFWLEVSAPVVSSEYLYFATVSRKVVDLASSPPKSVRMYFGVSSLSPYLERNIARVVMGGSFVLDRNVHAVRVAASMMRR